MNSTTISSSTTKQMNPGENKQTKLIEKLIGDLEELCVKIADISKNKTDLTIRDDCLELQKFCTKLEFLLQLNLKEKKSILSTSNSSNTIGDNGTNTSFKLVNTEYWSFVVDILKSSRGFQDAIKYVKSLNEVKSNLGRARAFIRFCLQYHRLADAVQQLTMEDKLLFNWYNEKAVWLNQSYKSRIIQLLYDLNEINFELISKNNFELDTSWPTMQLTDVNRNVNLSNPHQQLLARNRTASITSFSSIMVEREQTGDSSIQLLSSTPLEMDDDLMFANINTTCSDQKEEADESNLNKIASQNKSQNQNLTNENLMQQSVYYDVNNTNYFQQQLELNEKKIEELTQQLSLKDNKIISMLEDLKQKKTIENTYDQNLNNLNVSTSSSIDVGKDKEFSNLLNEVETLKKQLELKTTQNNELNDCLIKQTKFCENLSELLKNSEQKNSDFNEKINNHVNRIKSLESELDTLKQELSSANFELSSKIIEQENLMKDSLSQTQSINFLRENYSQQEKLIAELKADLSNIKEKRQYEIETSVNDFQRNKVALQLKEEENFLLNDHIQKLSRSLDEERKQSEHLTKELKETRLNFKQTQEKNTALINQLEMDNNEIKKRLVKLIKEKADLWQKADNLEYENLLKANAMWLDDSSISNCMNCNSGFSMMLRKHHCRICLKIYCYYCCNNWVEYNKSTLRVCKKCFDAKESITRTTTIKNSDGLASDAAAKNSSTVSNKDESELNEDNDEDDDDDDPDINFEVRPEKLNSFNNSHDDPNISIDDEHHNFNNEHDQDPDQISIYDMPAKPRKSGTLKKSSSSHNNRKDNLSSDELNRETNCDNDLLMDSKQDETFNTQQLTNKTENSTTISIKPHLKKSKSAVPLLAASEKSYLLASFFKKNGEHDQEQDEDHAQTTTESDLIVRRKKIKKKKFLDGALSTSSPSTSFLSINKLETFDTFAIVSKDEIDKL